MESGIDLGFDLTALSAEQLDLDYSDLEEVIGTLKNQEYYELKSKTVPETESPPSFKTATQMSRTQLKLQLMREQLQEQERREAEQKSPHSRRPPPAPALKVPIQSIGIDVPPQVLQVQTVLENPTRYHVIQKQKSQVRQYLSESFQQPTVATSASLLSPRTPTQNLQAQLSLQQQQQQQQQQSYSTAGSCYGVLGTGSGTCVVIPSASPDGTGTAMSPGLSSVATSTSEAEDLIDDLLSFESSSLASDSFKTNDSLTGAGNDLLVKPEPLILSDAELHALAKDRQKKDNHNMIERRRRFNINDRIKELGTLLPKTNDPYYEIVRDVRPNKGTILKSSVEYIKCLKNEIQRLKQTEARQKQMEHQNRKLLSRIHELEMQAKSHGLPVSDFNMQSSCSTSSSSSAVLSCLNSMNSKTSIQSQPHGSSSTMPPFAMFLSETMPDVVTEAALNMSAMDNIMDDDDPVNGDPMLSHPHSHLHDPMLSSPSHHSHNGDPMICEPRLVSPTCSHHTIDTVDTDSLVGDIDMIV